MSPCNFRVAEFVEFLARRMAAATPFAAICDEMIKTWLFATVPNAGVAYSLLEQALTWPQVILNSFSASMKDLDQRHRLSLIGSPALICRNK
jgi:hypothetical protein